MTTILDDLTTEYQAWCKANNLPCISADELACEPTLTPEQASYINLFMERWESANFTDD
jgi:hypothetical protein